MATSDHTASHRQINNKSNTAIRWNVDTGRIRVDAQAGRVYGASGILLNPTNKQPQGYQMIGLQCPDGGQVSVYLHRVIGYAVYGVTALINEINHIDEDKSNNRASNLEPVTSSENKQHSLSRVRHLRHTELSKEAVLEIRQLRAEGMKLRELAAQFDVSISTISMIANRKIWAWL